VRPGTQREARTNAGGAGRRLANPDGDGGADLRAGSPLADPYPGGMLLLLFLILLGLFVVLPLIGLAFWAFWSIIAVGLIVGALGRLLVPGPQPIGLLATLMVGLCGSIVGGFIGQHVLGVGHFATVLIEIGLAALVVAALMPLMGRRISRRW
jgi:uncharacterized membrane protein YeaQ/YmgE (transglycosylase-associated protein family)